jgi:hypothetical protein
VIGKREFVWQMLTCLKRSQLCGPCRNYFHPTKIAQAIAQQGFRKLRPNPLSEHQHPGGSSWYWLQWFGPPGKVQPTKKGETSPPAHKRANQNEIRVP